LDVAMCVAAAHVAVVVAVVAVAMCVAAAHVAVVVAVDVGKALPISIR